MNKSIACTAFAITVASSFIFAQPASAASLFFQKVAVKTSSEKTCLSFARDVAHNLGFANVHSNPFEVAGQKGGAYVSITCVGRGQLPAIAVVMSVSDSFDVAKQVGQSAAEKIQGIVCFDTPC